MSRCPIILRGNGKTQISNALITCVTLDITGTLTKLKTDVASAYCDAGRWVGISVSEDEMKKGFRAAFKEGLQKYPCFTGQEQLSDRSWWKYTVRRSFENCGCQFSGKTGEVLFDRLFLRVYQHFATDDGYELYSDVKPFITWCKEQGLLLGIISNNVTRIVDTTLPMLGVHKYFDFFVVSQEVGYEKPSPEIFQSALTISQTIEPSILPKNILHIGDNYVTDYCGSRSFGMQSLFLDRNHQHLHHQDWLVAPPYEGKTDTEHLPFTIKQLTDAFSLCKNA